MRVGLAMAGLAGLIATTSTLAARADVRAWKGCGAPAGDAPELSVVLEGIARPGAVERSICDWFRDGRWRVRFVRVRRGAEVAPSATAELSVRLRLASAHEAELRIWARARASDASGEAAAERRSLLLPNGLDEAGLETIAQVVHSSALAHTEQALSARAPVASQSAEDAPLPGAAPAPRGAAAAVNPADTSARARAESDRGVDAAFSLTTSAGLLAFARGAEPLTFGPGLRLDAEWEWPGLALGAYARGAVWTSTTKTRPELELSLTGTTLLGGAAARVPLGGVALRGALAGGVDWTRADVRIRAVDTLRPLPAELGPRPFLGAELGLGRRFGDLVLAASALLRWQLLASRYEAVAPDGAPASSLLRPWRLQPGASLDVGYVW